MLSGLEAALTRIDDFSDDEPCMPTWKDEDCEREEMGRRADVGNVWARVGDVECHTAVDPGSLARDECGSVLSESCWGEMEDIDEDEDVECGDHCHQRCLNAVPVSQGEELGPTPSVLRQAGGTGDMVRRVSHMHTIIDSDEEPLVTLSHMLVATQVDGSALSSQTQVSPPSSDRAE